MARLPQFFRSKPVLETTIKLGFIITAVTTVWLTQQFWISADTVSAPGGYWVRWNIPGDTKHWTRVNSEINPYGPYLYLTGSVGNAGLAANERYLPTRNDPATLISGESWSPWVQLPRATGLHGHSVLQFYFYQNKKPEAYSPVTLEFATEPGQVFKTIQEPMDPGIENTLSVAFLIPSDTSEAKRDQLLTFNEWVDQRLANVKALDLGQAPHLEHLKLGTWIHPSIRQSLSEASKERMDKEAEGAEIVGFNMVSSERVQDGFLRDIFTERGIKWSSITLWATGIYYNPASKIERLPDEPYPTYFERIFRQYYTNPRNLYHQQFPFRTSIAEHLNVGDEIILELTAKEINEDPDILADFRQYLQDQSHTPQFFGADSWEQVMATDDRSNLGQVEQARRFYHTWRYNNHYTAMFYGAARKVLEEYFPTGKLIAANYQAGLVQSGFVGNNNRREGYAMDYWQLAREGAFRGAMTEDWSRPSHLTNGWISWAAEVLQAVTRKDKHPTASYVVGGGLAKWFSYLMHGVKETGIYLWGPVRDIGSAISDQPGALKSTARGARLLKPFEKTIAEAEIRPRRVAILVAATADQMQAQGKFYMQERQNLYAALKHQYVQADIIGEQEITEDNILANYDVLYLADPNTKRDVQEKIAAWVEQGGHLWAQVGAAQWDEYNQRSDVLNPVFGVGNQTIETTEGFGVDARPFYWAVTKKYRANEAGKIRLNHSLFGGEATMTAWGAKLQTQPTTSQVIGTYDTNQPAAFLNTYGQGQAMLIGGYVGEAYSRSHWPDEHLTNPTGPDPDPSASWHYGLGEAERRIAAAMVPAESKSRPVVLSTPAIMTSIMDTKDASVIFLNNAVGRPAGEVTVSVQTDRPVKSVRSAERGTVSFTPTKQGISFRLNLNDVDILAVSYNPAAKPEPTPTPAPTPTPTPTATPEPTPTPTVDPEQPDPTLPPEVVPPSEEEVGDEPDPLSLFGRTQQFFTDIFDPQPTPDLEASPSVPASQDDPLLVEDRQAVQPEVVSAPRRPAILPLALGIMLILMAGIILYRHRRENA